jgi:fibronectin type 3 domain-containing protein
MEKHTKTETSSIVGVFLAVVIAMLMLVSAPAAAQNLLPILTQEDGLYIYHDQEVRLGNGFNVYRTVDGEETLLTDEPVFPAANGAEFQAMVMDHYQRLAADLETETPQETFFTLRGNRSLRLILSLTHPEIGKALGYLFVDRDPLPGRQVTYRFEWVNSRGEPVGDPMVEQIQVPSEPPEIPQADRIEGERMGNRVRVSWRYPEAREAGGEVVRFEVFVRPSGDEHYRRVTERSVMRQTGMTRFSYSFRLDSGVQEAEVMVLAIDHTGKNRVASDPGRVALRDSRTPSPVNEVYSTKRERRLVQITWPTGTEPFLAGYHVDRLDSDTEERVRLTEELIPVANPILLDDTVEDGKTYFYYVIAVSQTGIESEDGNPAIQFIESMVPPKPPSNLRAVVLEDGEGVRLDWDPSEKDDLFNTYVVLRRIYSEAGDRAFSQVNRSRVTGTTLIDRGIADIGFTEGLYYEYAVTASNAHGLRSDTIFAVMQMPDITPPDPPASFRAEIDRGARVNVTWAASPSTDVVAYNVYKTTNARDTSMVKVPRNRRFIVDENVVPGEIYRYFATAVDSVGNESSPSRFVEVMMRDFSPPPSVRNIQAVQTEEGVQLRWEPSPASDVRGYVIKRADLSNGHYIAITEEPIQDVSWVDSDGQAGKWYRVLAVDHSGNTSRPSTPRQAVRNN